MTRFFVNKYPVNFGFDKDNKPQRLEVGTIFTVTAINGNMFELEPASRVKDLQYPIMVDAAMLNIGFTGQDHIDA
jgi:hypothetical protein